jgi:prepilin-type processing-associated H-X9-DG protein
MKMYCSDYDDLYPPTRKWNDAIKPYVKDPKILICPKAGGVEPTYAMNDFLGGLSDVEIMSPAETVMVFESIPGINLAGGLELFQEPPRHKDAVNIGFADGHAESISPEYTDSLIWDPYSAVSGFDESDSEYY